MLFGLGNNIDKILRKNPNTKSIVIAGTFGHTSAIQALGVILGQKYTVTIGINPKIKSDIALFDYRKESDFPIRITPGVVVITSCNSEEEAKLYFDIANRAKYVFINYADVDSKYSKLLTNAEVTTYGDELPADYYFENQSFEVDGQQGNIVNPDRERFAAKIKVVGQHSLRPVTMAVAVAKSLGVERERILAGVNEVCATRGRMSPARGMRGSIIIDDSANLSPYSIKLGINAISEINAPSRIVVLDDIKKLKDANLTKINELLILSDNPEIKNPKVKYFSNELALMSYLGERLEADGIVLLEIPLPDIIESYIW